MRYTIETRKTCRKCRRTVDAVRAHGDDARDLPGLRLSRHFEPDALKFCRSSLDAVK